MISGHARGIVLAAVVSTLGCGGVASSRREGGASAPPTAEGGATSGEPVARASIDPSGRWAMLGFIDPSGVDLTADDGVLAGRGCLAGTPPYVNEPDGSCGDIRGTTSGNSVQFSFDFNFPVVGQGSYTAQVTISDDAQRMVGNLHSVVDGQAEDSPQPTTWLRVQPRNPGLQLPSDSPPAPPTVYTLQLRSTPSAGGRYRPNQSYTLSINSERVVGDLGAFWWTEFGPRRPNELLVVGPVPATDPTLPVAIRLTSDARGAAEVEATFSSGAKDTFTATRRD